MSQNLNSAIAVIGIDIGKNSFHVVGLDSRGAVGLRQKWSRGQVEARLANMELNRSNQRSHEGGARRLGCRPSQTGGSFDVADSRRFDTCRCEL